MLSLLPLIISQTRFSSLQKLLKCPRSSPSITMLVVTSLATIRNINNQTLVIRSHTGGDITLNFISMNMTTFADTIKIGIEEGTAEARAFDVQTTPTTEPPFTPPTNHPFVFSANTATLSTPIPVDSDATALGGEESTVVSDCTPLGDEETTNKKGAANGDTSFASLGDEDTVDKKGATNGDTSFASTEDQFDQFDHIASLNPEVQAMASLNNDDSDSSFEESHGVSQELC